MSVRPPGISQLSYMTGKREIAEENRKYLSHKRGFRARKRNSGRRDCNFQVRARATELWNRNPKARLRVTEAKLRITEAKLRVTEVKLLVTETKLSIPEAKLCDTEAKLRVTRAELCSPGTLLLDALAEDGMPVKWGQATGAGLLSTAIINSLAEPDPACRARFLQITPLFLQDAQGTHAARPTIGAAIGAILRVT